MGGRGDRQRQRQRIERWFAIGGDPFAAEKAGHHRQQRIDVHRLGDVGAAAGGQHFLFVACHRVGSERDDRQGAAAAPQFAGRAIAIQHRHLHVHQHQVEAAGGYFLERHLTVLGLVDPQAVLAEHQRHQFAVFRAVINHQHARRRDAPARRVGARHLVIGRMQLRRRHQARLSQGAGVEAQGEHAACAGPAAGDDVAAQRTGEFAADGKPEAGAAEAPRDRRIGLGEGLEQAIDLVGRHPDAAIVHFDGIASALVRRHAIEHHPHTASRGELDRVG